MSDAGFAEDDKIRQIAEAYALDAVDFAQNNFGLGLDWSDASVEHIEAMLTRLHNEMSKRTARARDRED